MRWHLVHADVDPADLHKKRMKRLAYVSRYANVTPAESRHYDSRWLSDFCDAIDEIVKEENTPRGTTDF